MLSVELESHSSQLHEVSRSCTSLTAHGNGETLLFFEMEVRDFTAKAWRDHLQVLPVHPRTCGSRPSLSIYTHPIYPHKQHVCSYGGSLDQDLRLAITLHNSRTRLKHRLMVY